MSLVLLLAVIALVFLIALAARIISLLSQEYAYAIVPLFQQYTSILLREHANNAHLSSQDALLAQIMDQLSSAVAVWPRPILLAILALIVLHRALRAIRQVVSAALEP